MICSNGAKKISFKVIPKSQVLRYETIIIPFLQNSCGENPTYYIYCILLLALSVLADMKNVISVFYQYRPLRKLSVSGFIIIGQYEKKLISHTNSGRTLLLKANLGWNLGTVCKNYGFK